MSYTRTEHHPPATVRSLTDLLRHRLETSPDLPIYRFLVDGEDQVATMTVRELERATRATAARLQQTTEVGDRVVLVYPPGNDFAVGLLACSLAGVISVPAPPPEGARLKQRLASIAKDCDGRVVLGHSSVPSDAVPGATFIASDTVDPALADTWSARTEQDADTIAYLQYTSGSTAEPRGVVVTHANALANCAELNESYGLTPDSVMVSWVPTHHDLGLIYAVLMPLFTGFPSIAMAPVAFVKRPLRWLKAITTWKGTHSIAPNFGFDLAVVRTKPEDRAGLDLSSWKHALNGAEPIREASETRFAEAFAASGFDARAISHSYGMSEATAKITAEHAGRRSVFARLDADALQADRVTDAAPGARTVSVAGNGGATGGTAITIVDPDTLAAVGEDTIGEIWIHGPSIGRGYWGREEASKATFGARVAGGDDRDWLRTGDLGFQRGGDLFVTGRSKDLIIVRGENHYPQDLEWSVDGTHAALRPHAQVAFSVDTTDGEGLGIAAEIYPDKLDDPEAVFSAMRDAVSEHGLQASTLALVPPGAVPKTTSGKVQRQLTKKQVLDGTIPVLARFDAAAPDRGALDGIDLAALVRSAPPAQRGAVLTLHARQLVAGLLGVSVAEVDPARPLKELGLDSINQIEMVERLATTLGIELPGSTVRDFPTLAGVVGAAVQRL